MVTKTSHYKFFTFPCGCYLVKGKAFSGEINVVGQVCSRHYSTALKLTNAESLQEKEIVDLLISKGILRR